ncbi:hypothetical protein LC040_05930 [Bacillus tianshenii]|nr:hypothetical protein LC040_05930 [Bacillus tianshenii]
MNQAIEAPMIDWSELEEQTSPEFVTTVKGQLEDARVLVVDRNSDEMSYALYVIAEFDELIERGFMFFYDYEYKQITCNSVGMSLCKVLIKMQKEVREYANA